MHYHFLLNRQVLCSECLGSIAAEKMTGIKSSISSFVGPGNDHDRSINALWTCYETLKNQTVMYCNWAKPTLARPVAVAHLSSLIRSQRTTSTTEVASLFTTWNNLLFCRTRNHVFDDYFTHKDTCLNAFVFSKTFTFVCTQEYICSFPFYPCSTQLYLNN